MREAEIDISKHHSEHVDAFLGHALDLVVTVCDGARQTCPTFPGAKRTAHWPFDNPVAGDATSGNQLIAFRRVRDEIARAMRSYLVEPKRM